MSRPFPGPAAAVGAALALLLQLSQVSLCGAVAVALTPARSTQAKPVVRREAGLAAAEGGEEDEAEGAGGASLLEQGAGAGLAALAGRMDDGIDATLRRHGAAAPAGGTGKVLFVVYSGSQFYSTRVKWLVDTWASSLVPSDLVVVSDRLPATAAERASVGRATIHATACQAHSHEQGMCCKLGEAAVLTAAFFQKYPNYKWAYLTDDDVYIRPGAVQRFLEAQPASGAPGVVFGTFGCRSDRCPNGLCGGGGYAASSGAMAAVVGGVGGTQGFLKETMSNCDKCAGWADLAVSQLFFERKLDTRPLVGSYPFRLTKPCFDAALADATKDPLEFHYVTSEHQMRLLHTIFGAGNATASSSPELCTSFRSRTACAASAEPAELPWDVSSKTTC